MVENRPDWCLSRQRLWGVPIPAFYCKKCSNVLMSPEIIEHVQDIVKEHGSTIWFEKTAGGLLPDGTVCPECGHEKFNKEEDILDVWFDSGISHFAVLEPRKILCSPADLYLEGSDQHRGWFQTSILTAMGINGFPPFKSVLTHGFVVDGEGKKMSKSGGNVISPEQVMKKYGADILRLWVASTDYSSDARISEEILSQIADAYRRIRNIFRFLLGNLFDFRAASEPLQNVTTEIDRWALSKTASLIKNVTKYYENFKLYKAFQLIYEFCNIQMSSFYLDILKDRLYTFAPDSKERRSSQAAFAYISVTLTKLLAPVLSFTAEEIFSRSSSREKSIHLCSWPEVDKSLINRKLEGRWDKILKIRGEVLRVIENLRKEKVIGNSLECKVTLYVRDDLLHNFLKQLEKELPTIFIVSETELVNSENGSEIPDEAEQGIDIKDLFIQTEKSKGTKCQRCWRLTGDIGKNTEYPEICSRCANVLTTRTFQRQ
jgi:isoleucyl-tRNA synthetase